MSDEFREKLESIGFSGLRSLNGKPKISVVKPGRGKGNMGYVVISSGDKIETRDLTQMAQERAVYQGNEAKKRTSTYDYYGDSTHHVLEKKA